ncbi:LysE/ArgO family amino acid transporter [Psychrilyobacter sp.]|uniref:LysE/ArgO family amino acid transporter n=1 Tax=Psychrilyobacter sp. TaxID=2586924 RepID=UPI003C71A3FE
MVTVLALSLLNPHVYLDTVISIGSIGSQFPLNQRIYFINGTYLASFVWFFGLAYGARILIPIF